MTARLVGFASAGGTFAATAALLGLTLSRAAVHAQSTAGKAAFERICAGCHGAEGAGDVGPRLVPFTKSNRELLGIVREGTGQMPALSARDVSDEEVAGVADYLRSLSRETSPSTGPRPSSPARPMNGGVPLSQVRDLLGHCSIIVTERCDRVRLDSLKAAVARLDDGQPFKNLSSPEAESTPVESASSSH